MVAQLDDDDAVRALQAQGRFEGAFCTDPREVVIRHDAGAARTHAIGHEFPLDELERRAGDHQ